MVFCRGGGGDSRWLKTLVLVPVPPELRTYIYTHQGAAPLEYNLSLQPLRGKSPGDCFQCIGSQLRLSSLLVKKSGLLATLRQQFVFKSKVEPSYRATRPKKWPKSGGYEVKMRITPSDENAHGYGMWCSVSASRFMLTWCLQMRVFGVRYMCVSYTRELIEYT